MGKHIEVEKLEEKLRTAMRFSIPDLKGRYSVDAKEIISYMQKEHDRSIHEVNSSWIKNNSHDDCFVCKVCRIGIPKNCLVYKYCNSFHEEIKTTVEESKILNFCPHCGSKMCEVGDIKDDWY